MDRDERVSHEAALALARTFASRLRESEYGWSPLNLANPFNVTAARQALHDEALREEGQDDQAAGQVTEAFGEGRRKVGEAIKNVADKISH